MIIVVCYRIVDVFKVASLASATVVSLCLYESGTGQPSMQRSGKLSSPLWHSREYKAVLLMTAQSLYVVTVGG